MLDKILSDRGKVLGVNWNTINDSFSFSLRIIAMKKPEHDVATKRISLKVIASMYDPLYIVIPIMAKILFQEVCTETLNWDKELNETCGWRWRQLLKELEEGNTIEVGRCALGPVRKEGNEWHLHRFL